MKKLMTLTLLLTAAFALTTCGSIGTTPKSGGIPYTGDGGKGTSIAILPPQGVGLSEDLDYLPALVQGEFVSNFSGYSAIDVLDRVALESQYAELLSGYYPDDAEGVITLGHLPPTTYLMMGKITKTSSGYALQITVAKNADGATAAAYSGTCTVAELDNFTGIRRSSQELLEKMGVELNDRAKTELAGSAIEQSVNAQTALAKGITAQKDGTEVKALAYYYQAVGFDPSLKEAKGRASVISANISSGNIGEDARNKIAAYRNDIAHRDAWKKVMDECKTFLKDHIPFEIVVNQKLKQKGDIDYENETITLEGSVTIKPSNGFDMIRDVLKGLKKTGRQRAWGDEYEIWPFSYNITHFPFRLATGYGFSGANITPIEIELALVNAQGQIIGTRGKRGPLSEEERDQAIREIIAHHLYIDRWAELDQIESHLAEVDRMRGRGPLEVYGYAGTIGHVNPKSETFPVVFGNVNANNITDSMTIKVISVNGIDAETAGRTGYIRITAGR